MLSDPVQLPSQWELVVGKKRRRNFTCQLMFEQFLAKEKVVPIFLVAFTFRYAKCHVSRDQGAMEHLTVLPTELEMCIK